MHIQVVTFTSDISRRDYENMVIEGAPVWAAVPGLIIKHFVYNLRNRNSVAYIFGRMRRVCRNTVKVTFLNQ